MSTVLATTNILIESPSEDEPGDGRTWSIVADVVPATIGSPGGSEAMSPGGGQQQLRATLICDPVDGFDHTCRVTDNLTGEIWEVSWVKAAYGLLPGVPGRARCMVGWWAMSEDSVFIINPVGMAELFLSPTGPVARDLVRRSIQVETFAKQLASAHGRGAVYGNHQASAPGDPFASDTGSLRASITHDLAVDAAGLLARIGSGDNRMAWLELGTTRIQPRPTLRPALVAAAR